MAVVGFLEVDVEGKGASCLGTNEKGNRSRGEDKNNFMEYEWFAIYFVHFADDTCNKQSFYVLSSKAEWTSSFRELYLVDGMPVCTLESIFTRDAFWSTSIEQKVVFKRRMWRGC